MFQAVQDLEINTSNMASKKLQFVKLIFIAITLGFTLTVTVLVSEDKNLLSKLNYALKCDFPITSESRLCQNDDRFNLSLGLYAKYCTANSNSFLILQRIESGGKTKSEISLNSHQWKLLKLNVKELDTDF